MRTPRAGPGRAATEGIVGRRRELGVLHAALSAARDGAGGLVLCAGEPGIGKTRLAQELAGAALARGTAVAWGRCAAADGAPPLWPWRQVLRSLGAGPDAVPAGPAESPQDRFRLVDEVAEAVRSATPPTGLLVVLDDVHRADEPSLLVLRLIADRPADVPLLVLATFRDGEPSAPPARLLSDLLRSPRAERLDLRGFDLAEVHELLSRLEPTAGDAEARRVLDLTGGNPLFVREVARAMADGSWRADRPPRTVLDVVAARLDRISAGCRGVVQAAAIAGREFSPAVVAAALDLPVAECLPLVDEAVAHGLVERAGGTDGHRFVHALTRDAVEASLGTAARAWLHRAVAVALEARFAGDLTDHLADLARHWAEVAPYGDAEIAREWAVRAADDAMRRLAFAEGARLYRAALALDRPRLPDGRRYRLLVALGRAAYLAGDPSGCADAATAAAAAARALPDPELVAEAALVVEAAPDPAITAVATELSEEALAGLGDTGHEGLRARLLAQRSHLAFYAGEQDRVGPTSATAVELARGSGDDRALVDAFRARQEALPGPSGRAERVRLASEMLALARRTGNAGTAVWGELWRIDTLLESGRLAAAADALPALRLAAQRAGGPVNRWHHERVAACVGQAQGRYAEAAAVAGRAFDRMRAIEAAPAIGVHFGFQCVLARHVGVTDEALRMARHPFEPPPRFRTMARLSRAFVLLQAGLPDEAEMSYRQAGPVDTWALPPFFTLPARAHGVLVAGELGRHDDLAALLDLLEPFRGEHAVGSGGPYLGPVELTLGRGAAALGRLDRAVDDLAVAAEQADRAGAPGFLAEACRYLGEALLARDGPGDRRRAERAAGEAERLARALGMAGYAEQAAALRRRLQEEGRRSALSPREAEVAELVAEGLTNRQLAVRLVISERTAQNHVQHILTKLGFRSRSQIAAWVAGRR